MIDHTSLAVKDLQKSKAFYVKALAPLGYVLIAEYNSEVTGTVDLAGLGVGPRADFWLGLGVPSETPHHVAFAAKSRREVDEFYKAAIAAGGKDNGKPGLRPEYDEKYYGAFVRDPDGYNIEAVCRGV